MTDKIKTVVLSLWLGAALFFSAVVAPTAFAVLRQAEIANAGELAGRIVTRTLSVVNLSGFLFGLPLFVAALFSRKKRGVAFMIQLLSLAVLSVTTAVGHWLVAARMVALRAALTVPIDQLALNDPRRMVFDQLHRYSVALLSVAMLAALVAIVLRVGRNSN
jgi:Domain of unknown function (DUF4149)